MAAGDPGLSTTRERVMNPGSHCACPVWDKGVARRNGGLPCLTLVVVENTKKLGRILWTMFWF